MSTLDETAKREAVVAAARSWIGTPYHHGGDCRGLGVDCLMLLVRVFVDEGLIPAFDPRPYPQHWHLHRDEERYRNGILEHAVPVATPSPGDIVLWRYGRTLSHAGIVTAWPRFVHAHARSGCVEEADASCSGELAARERAFFSPWSAS